MIAEIPKLIQPRAHKAKVQIWLDLTVNDMDRLEELETSQQIKDELASIFQLGDYKENLKSTILVDLYYYTINFSRENKFSKEQTSAFFSIVKRTHEVCVETPFGNVEHCFNYFRELILCHAVKRPPFSIDLFSPDEVRKVTNYVINTYFRHYKMYKYVFTPLVRLDLSMTYVGMPETPPPSEGEPEPVVDEGAAEGEAEMTETEGATEQSEAKAEEKAEEVPAEQPKEGLMRLTLEEGELFMGVIAVAQSDDPVKSDLRSDITFYHEESAAASELRGLIKEHLSDEIKKLKVSMDNKLKDSEEVMNQKLAALEGSSSAKGSRGSGKSRKK